MQLHKLIDDLRLEIEVEQENYKTAIINRLSFPLLRQMRLNIRKLRADVKLLVDKQTNA